MKSKKLIEQHHISFALSLSKRYIMSFDKLRTNGQRLYEYLLNVYNLALLQRAISPYSFLLFWSLSPFFWRVFFWSAPV
jgi:hypothetical protein